MTNFIVRMIEKEAKKSLAQGKDKYRAYFVNTDLYVGYKDSVDAKLTEDGYKKVIVSK